MKTLRPRGAYAMKNNRGQVLIETALILPLLLLLIFGMVDFGRAMYTKNTLTNAARSGARAAAVTSPLYPIPPATPLSLATPATGEPANSIQKTLSSGVPQDAEIQYEVGIYDGTGAPVAGTVDSGNQVRVTLTYQNFPLITPLYKLMALITKNPSKTPGSMTISGEASMRYE